jgi:hypothetical protein
MKMEYKPRQIRRGTNAERVALGGLAAGELGFETDTLDIYIGSVAGDKLIADRSALDFLNGQDQAVKTTDSPAFAGMTLGPSARNLKTWSNLDDFIGGAWATGASGIWNGVTGGTGATISDIQGTALRPGIIQFSTGTTNTGYALYFTGRASCQPILFGSGVYTFETDIYIPTLSAVAEEYILRFGFADAITGADISDGAYFEYDRLTNVNWLAKTAANSARTATATATAVAAAAWIRLKVIVNATGTAAYFYINDVLVATNILNIPTGAGRQTSCNMTIVKSAGTTARTFQGDWAWLHIDLTTSR